MSDETSHLPGPEYGAAGPQYVGGASGVPNVYAMPLAEDQPHLRDPSYDSNPPTFDARGFAAIASNYVAAPAQSGDSRKGKYTNRPVYASEVPATVGAAGPTVYYDAALGAGGTGAPGESDYALIPDQSGGTLPRQVALSKGSDTALWMHRVGRGGAEAVLEAAAAADPAVLRYLVRPKGAGFVLSICQLKTASKPRFFHDFIVAREDGQFTIKGKVGGSVIGVAGQVVETMSKNIGGTGSEPVLRGDGGLTASEVTDTFC